MAPLAVLLILVVMIRVIYRKARRRPGGGFGVGPGASGAMYGFLHDWRPLEFTPAWQQREDSD